MGKSHPKNDRWPSRRDAHKHIHAAEVIFKIKWNAHWPEVLIGF